MKRYLIIDELNRFVKYVKTRNINKIILEDYFDDFLQRRIPILRIQSRILVDVLRAWMEAQDIDDFCNRLISIIKKKKYDTGKRYQLKKFFREFLFFIEECLNY